MSVFNSRCFRGSVARPARAVALVVALGLGACKPTAPDAPPVQAPPIQEPVGSSLYLEVRSLAGEAVAGAQVDVASGQHELASEQGTLLLEKLTPGAQVVRVSAPRYVSSVLGFTLPEEVNASVRLSLMPQGEPSPSFDPHEAWETDKDGVHLGLPKEALRDKDGQVLGGLAEVSLSVLEQEGEALLAAPGALRGLVSPGQQPVPLESWGLVAVGFQSQGKAVADVRGVRMRGRVRGLGDKRPWPQAPVWRLEPGTGVWVPTGVLASVREMEPGRYEWDFTMDNPPGVFTVALPFWWRSEKADASRPLQAPGEAWVETACLEVRVVDEQGKALAGQWVQARGARRQGLSVDVEYVGLSRGMTDARGRVLLEVMRGREVELSLGEQTQRVAAVEAAGDAFGHGAAPTGVTLTARGRGCTPGAVQQCPYTGPAGTEGKGACRAGKQTCNATGSDWSTCVGEVLPQAAERCDTPEDDDCDGVVNESCMSVCAPGMSEACAYSGPVGTEGVGPCHAGTRTCDASGSSWSDCTGEVVPQPEVYANEVDEDCDGVVSLCAPGASEACAYTGPAGTEGVGACHAGARTCDASGTRWGACSGEVVPRPEVYANAVDEDCDGVVSLCAPGASESCYTGPGGTVGVGECRAGARTCDASGTSWSACSEEVVPQIEVCSNGLDEDCNGYTDDSAVCAGFFPTGSMLTRRTVHTATLLPDGTVLVAGGFGLGEAELYDPNTGTWFPTASMSAARGGSMATLLPDGTVLVTGGYAYGTGGAHVLGTAELYDPTKGTWSPTGAMSTPRYAHTATLLADGKVLVMGGFNDDGLTDKVELYDPTKGTWSPMGAMSIPRYGHTATLLADGKVLVTGGDGHYQSTAELYDPTSGTWSATGPMGTTRSTRFLHTATLLTDGRVLVTGGENTFDESRVDTAELYDPTSRTWSATGLMIHERSRHTATVLADGRVLVTGGGSPTAELYDPTSGTWSLKGSMNDTRKQHTATVLADGRVLLTGGHSGPNLTEPRATAEVYDPRRDPRYSAPQERLPVMHLTPRR